jgi:DNA-3-methyladenine glycosylase II
MMVESRRGKRTSRHEIDVTPPFRLDLTVNVLRRLSTNVVDVLTPAGEYLRVLGTARSNVLVRVAQMDAGRLSVALEGSPSTHSAVLERVRRTLGVDRDLSPFYRAAADIPWLRPLARRMRGVKPPRYPSLWEACVNAVTFQQISLQAASSIVHRITVALERPRQVEGGSLVPFPGPRRVLAADEATLRDAGLSRGKLETLRRLGEAIEGGSLSEQLLDDRPSVEAAEILRRFKGVGPWTASLILLRGLGRLDVFPGNDSGVARNLALVTGSTDLDLDALLGDLHPQQGMLYYHLLLARLESSGTIPTTAAAGNDEIEPESSEAPGS